MRKMIITHMYKKNGYSALSYYFENIGWIQWNKLERCDIDEFI